MNTTFTLPARRAGRWLPLLSGAIVALALMLGGVRIAGAADAAPAAASSAGLASLMTDTPEAGFALAVKLSQKGVATTQADATVRKGLRNTYAHNPDSLIAASQVIAIHFQTIAAANDYWRK